MLFNDIVKLTNTKLAGERIPLQELLPYLDTAVDAINTKLNAKYPSFSTVASAAGATGYNVFPDKYIRSVVVPYAIWQYYVADEEGLQAAPQFQQDANLGLFYMQRDMLYKIPAEYQDDDEQGSVLGSYDSDMFGYRGIVCDLEGI